MYKYYVITLTFRKSLVDFCPCTKTEPINFFFHVTSEAAAMGLPARQQHGVSCGGHER